jgi:hypothetical protein
MHGLGGGPLKPELSPAEAERDGHTSKDWQICEETNQSINLNIRRGKPESESHDQVPFPIQAKAQQRHQHNLMK